VDFSLGKQAAVVKRSDKERRIRMAALELGVIPLLLPLSVLPSRFPAARCNISLSWNISFPGVHLLFFHVIFSVTCL